MPIRKALACYSQRRKIKGRFVRSSDRNKKLCIRNTFGALEPSIKLFVHSESTLIEGRRSLIAQAKLAT
jgi:hypothetical protein